MSDTLREELVRLTNELVVFPSTSDRPDQLQAVIDYAERYVRAIPGVFVHVGIEAEKPYLVATLRDTRSPAVMLNAHLDVVPARPEQFTPEIRGERIYARASQDMKGSGAVLLQLLKDLAALDEKPDVGFMFVSDEEIGGEHGTGFLAKNGWDCEFFLAAEPTDLNICYAHKGAVWIDVRLPGVTTHGSRPWSGKNPLHDLRDGLVALEQHYPTPTEEAWRTTVTPTVVHGGDAGNRLASEVKLTFDVRFVPEDKPDDILANVKTCFPTAEVTTFRCGEPLDTDPEHPAVKHLAACVEATTGSAPELYREHFATDARFYSTRGIPAVCLGPIGKGLHSDEEWVDIASLSQLYAILNRFVLEYNDR